MSGDRIKPGRVEEISSTANPRVKAIRALAMKKVRERENLFVAEGEKLATDALAAGWSIDTLIHGRREGEAADRVDALAARACARGADIMIASDKVLAALTRRDNAQNVVSVISPKLAEPSRVKPEGTDTVWLALDRVRDPGNLGTIIRTADALGAAGVILIGETTDPFAIETVRATMGSLFHVPLLRMTEPEFTTLAEKWKTGGGEIVGTHLEGATDHRMIGFGSAPTIVLMGNEQQGLTEPLAACCSRLALIAMAGQADSLNLAVATGIVLFAARQHALPVSSAAQKAGPS